MWINPKVTIVIIAAAMHTPRKMAGMAFFSRMSSTAATKAPVQAPVPGSGMATRMQRPMVLYYRTTRPFRWAFFSSRVIFSSHHLLRLRSQVNTCRM